MYNIEQNEGDECGNRLLAQLNEEPDITIKSFDHPTYSVLNLLHPIRRLSPSTGSGYCKPVRYKCIAGIGKWFLIFPYRRVLCETLSAL
jgi:hypothetical protein